MKFRIHAIGAAIALLACVATYAADTFTYEIVVATAPQHNKPATVLKREFQTGMRVPAHVSIIADKPSETADLASAYNVYVMPESDTSEGIRTAYSVSGPGELLEIQKFVDRNGTSLQLPLVGYGAEGRKMLHKNSPAEILWSRTDGTTVSLQLRGSAP